MKFHRFLLVALLGLLLISCSENGMLTNPTSTAVDNIDNQQSLSKKPSMSGNTIVDIASGNPDFSVLVDAVVFAGLTETLSGNRQFTVFAPTNGAFVNLLSALSLTPAQLFVPENKELVKKILLYHVAPGERFADDVVSSDRIRTMAREFAFVDINNGAFIGNDDYGYAQIIQTDIDASNGVIHVINEVIIPPSLDLGI